VKTTLDLPEDLVRELKLRSVHDRLKLKDVAASALRRGLGLESTAVAKPEQLPQGLGFSPQGFPVFDCRAGTPVKKMSAREIVVLEQEIIAEEDLNRGGLAR
jgi:hypothetical protein